MVRNISDTAPTARKKRRKKKNKPDKTMTVKKQRAHLRINNRIKQQQIEPPV